MASRGDSARPAFGRPIAIIDGMWVMARVIALVLLPLCGTMAAEPRTAAQPETLRSSQWVGLLPEQPEAAALEDALDRYRVIAADGGWPQQPRGLVLRPGDDPPPAVLSDVLARLKTTRDLPSNFPSTSVT